MFTSPQSLGIDFRDDRLRLAHLAGRPGRVRLLNYASFALPPAREGNLSEYEAAFIETLRNFVLEHRVKAEQVILGLPQKEVVFRRLEVPAVKPDEIRQILEFEIERHVPFPLKNIYFDFQLIGPKSENKLEIALIAAKKERVNYLLSLLARAEVTYTGVELTTSSLFAGLDFQEQKSKQEGNYLMVEVGFNDIELGVVQKGKFVFCHRIAKQVRLTAPAPLGGDGMEETPEAANPPKLEPAPAKLVPGFEQGAGEENRKLADRLKQEISFLVTSLQKTYRETNLERIFLAGIDASAALAENLQAATQIETTLWNPPQGINSSGPEEMSTEGVVAIGLALQGLGVAPIAFNLMPPEEQAAQKKGASLVLPIILGAIMVLLALGNGASYLLKERTQLEQMEEKIAQLQPQLREVEKASRRYQQLQEREKNLEIISQQPASLLAVLKELTIKLPSDVWLERFKMSKKGIEIAGFAKSASNLIPVLEDSPLFKDVKFTSTITSKGGGKERFKLKITLEQK